MSILRPILQPVMQPVLFSPFEADNRTQREVLAGYVASLAAQGSFWFDFTDTSTLYLKHDKTGGNVTTTNDPIGLAVSLYSGLEAKQTTDANRPKWNVGGVYDTGALNGDPTKNLIITAPVDMAGIVYVDTPQGWWKYNINALENDPIEVPYWNTSKVIFVPNTTPAQAAIVESILHRNTNDIGIMGGVGAGVGICPEELGPEWKYLGNFDRAGGNYGNYEHTHADGVSKSIMTWIPACWLRIGHVDSPVYATYGLNSIDALPISYFTDDAAANAQGYFRHRALYDGGEVKTGFFRDKTHCSASVNGVAVSAAMAPPLSSAATHNPFSSVGASNAYWGAFQVAKSRGANFFPSSLFIEDYIAKLSMAHGQHSTSTATCAWWTSSGVSAPRGNNSNTFRDVDDTSVEFIHDGYASGNSALTMSANNLAKTTHNGQACGIADVNGNMNRICPGIASEGIVNLAITGATKANPCVLTFSGNHLLNNGDMVYIASVAGMTQLNTRIFEVTVVDATHVSLNVDSSSFGTYTSGGSANERGAYYILKDNVRMADLTGGNTLASDAWGVNGMAANYDQFDMAFNTVYPNNIATTRYGNGNNQVFSPATSGMAWRRACAGLPHANGISTGGTTLFGSDYYYQAMINQMCPLRGGNWANSTATGVWSVNWRDARTNSNAPVGVSLASYL